MTDADLDRSAFTQRLRISAPAEYTINSTGILTADVVKDGRRTRGLGERLSGAGVQHRGRPLAGEAGSATAPPSTTTAITPTTWTPWSSALDGARRWYAEWFGPYPWRELRLNEFPNYAEYARGNATNIFFSEGVGFLTLRTPESDQAFEIAAHEAAHQWWGHILARGEGPGGIVLAEGAANFATLMLVEQVRGLENRLGFAAAHRGHLRRARASRAPRSRSPRP